MPIRPENKARYPANWTSEIRPAIMQRAGFACEHPGCRCRHYAVGHWLLQPVGRENWIELLPPPPFVTLPFRGYAQQRQRAAEIFYERYGDEPSAAKTDNIIVVVLTCAHLDHTPENCDPSNLRMLCQRHHLFHDHGHHIANAYTTRMKKRNNQELQL